MFVCACVRACVFVFVCACLGRHLSYGARHLQKKTLTRSNSRCACTSCPTEHGTAQYARGRDSTIRARQGQHAPAFTARFSNVVKAAS
eukprot:3643373-Pleurochrysis_carterae.AAC.1